MSALGDYIHLHTSNYLKYGVAKKGEAPKHFSGAGNFLANRMAAIKPLNEKTIQTLETRLKQNTSNQEATDKKKSDLDFQQKLDTVYEYIASYSLTGAMGQYVDSSTGMRGYSKPYENLKSKTLSQAEIEKRKSLLKTIHTKIEKINKEGIKGNVSETELNELLSLYQQAGGNKTFSSSSGIKSVLGQLQEAANELSYNTCIGHVVGEFGEHLTAMCADKVEDLANDALGQFFKESVVGKQKTSILLDKKQVAKNLSSYLSTDKLGNSYYLGTTQNKVDVKIVVNQEDVLVNVKEYYGAKKALLQKEISLFSSLAYLEQYEQFGTHWLNMHTGTIKGSGRASADKTLKQEIMYEALVSGNPLKQKVDHANIFVYIDRKTGRVLVKDTKTLLTKESERIRITPQIEGIKFTNRFSKKSFEDRISSILMQAHGKQLKASMSVL